MNQTLLEFIGYLGSVLIAISLTMKSLVRLRLINLAGALVFTIYGLLIRAYPVAALDGIIVAIDLYYLLQMWRQKDYFKLLEVSHDSAYLRSFVEFYRKEIAVFFPNYTFNPDADDLAVFVLRNMVPAGVLVVHRDGEQARVVLDFVIPGYRDFRAGRFLFEESAEFFRKHGLTRFVSEAGIARHESYLRRMGFELRNGLYYRNIPSRQMLQDKGM
jgi:GNAT superfamily N-acetyltransferase